MHPSSSAHLSSSSALKLTSATQTPFALFVSRIHLFVYRCSTSIFLSSALFALLPPRSTSRAIGPGGAPCLRPALESPPPPVRGCVVQAPYYAALALADPRRRPARVFLRRQAETRGSEALDSALATTSPPLDIPILGSARRHAPCRRPRDDQPAGQDCRPAAGRLAGPVVSSNFTWTRSEMQGPCCQSHTHSSRFRSEPHTTTAPRRIRAQILHKRAQGTSAWI